MPKAAIADIRRAILRELPKDGTRVGNTTLCGCVAVRLDERVPKDDYLLARNGLVDEGTLSTGHGRGGIVGRFGAAEPRHMLRYMLKELTVEKEFRDRRRVTLQEIAKTGTRNNPSYSVRCVEDLVEFIPDGTQPIPESGGETGSH